MRKCACWKRRSFGSFRKRKSSFYEVRKGKVRFKEEARTRHKHLVKRFTTFLRGSRWMILLTAPIIWSCLIPVMLLGLFVTIYQAICFPIYGIPKVERVDFVRLDRRHLAYLNWIEKLNCEYCGYANGVIAAASECGKTTPPFHEPE